LQNRNYIHTIADQVDVALKYCARDCKISS